MRALRCGSHAEFEVLLGVRPPIGQAVERERQQRKLVTVLFCDMVGSTALGERLDAEVLRGVMNRYFAAASAVISKHGNCVEKFIGDAVVAVFGIPLIHDDDALRAVRAAAEVHAAIAVLGDETEASWGVRVQTRIGVSTGEVVVGDDRSGHAVVTGDTMNLAARLEQAAHPDEVFVGDVTWQLVRDAVVGRDIEPLVVKGKAEPVTAHRLVEVVSDAPGHARRMDLRCGRSRGVACCASRTSAGWPNGRAGWSRFWGRREWGSRGWWRKCWRSWMGRGGSPLAAVSARLGDHLLAAGRGSPPACGHRGGADTRRGESQPCEGRGRPRTG